MLRGAKPLARFSDWEGDFPDVLRRYLRLFDRHVKSGRFVRHDEIVSRDDGRVHYIYFALPNEKWRISAMIDLLSRPGKWSRAREREEGELLGYAAWQNEIWLSTYYNGPN